MTNKRALISENIIRDLEVGHRKPKSFLASNALDIPVNGCGHFPL